MKQKILILFAILATTINASAYDFEVDGIFYNYLSQVNLTCAVTNSDTKYSGDIVIPSTVIYNGNTFSVKSIGEEAFYYCTGLTSVTIPNSVTSIEKYAFEYCTSLTSVTIPNSVTSIGYHAFSGCKSLASVTIPNSVKSIDENAFEGCSSLTSVTIPNSVTSIGKWAFSECSSLTSVVIPNSVTSIETNTFSHCTSLTSVTIPGSVTSIGQGAFEYCSSLTSVTIPNSVTSIERDVFYNCSNLTSVTIPNSITTIGRFAFDGCSSLSSVEIPNSVTSIGQAAFYNCSSLTSVDIPNSITTIGDGVFGECSRLSSITGKFASEDHRCLIVEGVLNSFARGGMTTYTIPNSVTSIGNGVFSHCTNLTSVTIPNSVTTIGNVVFQYCSSLTSVTIGNSVTSIGSSAFGGCTSLQEIISLSTTPPTAQNSTFYSVPTSTCIVIVPTPEAVTAYKADAIWGTFNNIISAINPESQIIYYTTTDGNIIEPNKPKAFGANITSNTYENGQGKIVFDGDVTTIGDYAFSNCSKLTSLKIPSSVTTIGLSAFSGCSGLTLVEIPNSVTSIGDYAFNNCSGLTSVEIPNSVTEIAEWVFHGCSNLTSVTIPGSVTSIGEYAFGGCRNITTVKIPGSVTSIGYAAFYECSSLTSVTIPNSVTSIGWAAFSYCSSLTSFTGKFASDDHRCLIVDGVLNSFAPAGLTIYTIPSSVTTIGNQVFYNCSSLTSVTIPISVTSIGSSVFYNCTSLQEIISLSTTPPTAQTFTFYSAPTSTCIVTVPTPEAVTAYKADAFWGKFTNIISAINPESQIIYYTTTDGNIIAPTKPEAFGANITSNTYENGQGKIVFDGDVTTIGDYAFSNCSKLTSLTIPSSVTTIGLAAFLECSGLTSVEIPNSITKIGDNAFLNCSGLTSVEIPNSVTEIGGWVFCGCSNLTSVTIPGSVTSIGAYAFGACRNLTTVEIPSSVTTIGDSAFSGCANLTSVEIPNSVTSIGASAFYLCSSLTSFTGKFASDDHRCLIVDGVLNSFAPAGLTTYTIPNFITEIGEWVFYGCTNLTSVTIPKSVTTIGNYAFYNCTNLHEIISLNATPPTVQSDTFYSTLTSTCIVTVPTPEAVTAYKADAIWGTFTNIISAINPQSQIIYYTTTDANIIEPNNTEAFGANIISNTYENGQGKIVFDGDVTAIGDNAFGWRQTLVSVVIPSSVTSIGRQAFGLCYNLTSVEIPNSVTSIGKSAFSNCTNLTSVTIPNSVTTIEENTFFRCSSLTSVTIPNSVTTIGLRAFWECSNLTSVTIPNSVTTIGWQSFACCYSLTSVEIPVSVISIGGAAFYLCSSLKSFTGKFASDDHRCLIVDGVLNSFAPAGLTSYEIPNAVTAIGESTFSDCSDLTSVVIPSSVISIGRSAFLDCTGLQEIISLSTTPPTLGGSNCFQNVPSTCRVIVPTADAVAEYQAADYWKDFEIITTEYCYTDNLPYTHTFELENCMVSYTRTVTHNNWQGVYLPFDVDITMVAGTCAMLTSVSDNTLNWTTVDSGTIPAGTPFIYKPTAVGDIIFSATGAKLHKCSEFHALTYGDYTLSGTYTEKTDMAATQAYALSHGNFYRTNDDSKTLKPYRIFLSVPSSIACVRSRIDGEDVTAIEDIDVDMDNHGQQQFNLQGVRVDDSYRGIVIVNGKKVLRK